MPSVLPHLDYRLIPGYPHRIHLGLGLGWGCFFFCKSITCTSEPSIAGVATLAATIRTVAVVVTVAVTVAIAVAVPILVAVDAPGAVDLSQLRLGLI